MEEIPQQKSFDGLRVVVYGPESTGKSTLSRKLAQHYRTQYVEEFARNYLQDKYNRTQEVCSFDDLLPITIGQRLAENTAALKAKALLICDTDPLETYVYSQAYFNKAPKELIKAIQNSHYDLYLLMNVDLPWVADDLRDKPNERSKMFLRFEEALREFDQQYVIVNGLGDQRLKNAIRAIDKLKQV